MANIPHCDVRDHAITTGESPARCAFCNRCVCFEHTGNPNDLAGNSAACIDHVEEVAQMNRTRWQRYYYNTRDGAPESEVR